MTLRESLMCAATDPPPSAWRACIALITAEVEDLEVSLRSLLGEADPVEVMRAAGWLAARLVDMDRDAGAALVRDVATAAAEA